MALTADRDTKQGDFKRRHFDVKAANKYFGGALAMLDSDGRVRKGATATGMRGIGRVAEFFDNTNGADDAAKIKVEMGVFRWKNSAAGDAIGKAQIGSICYIVDDETVAKTDGTGTRSPAGQVVDVDELGVWVLMGFVEGPISGALAAANNLSDLANKSTARGNLGVYEKMGTPGFVIGDEVANAINVAIQLKDSAGADLAVRGSLFAYLSDDANGDSIVGTAPDGGWAIGTDGVLIPVVAGKAAQLVSESDGDIDVTITHAAGAKTVYLILVMPDGKLAASGAITFA
jgi:hypothetical protein